MKKPSTKKVTLKNKKESKKEKEIMHEENYIAFLRKQLDSENYKANVSEEEYEKQKSKLNKAKFKLRILKNE